MCRRIAGLDFHYELYKGVVEMEPRISRTHLPEKKITEPLHAASSYEHVERRTSAERRTKVLGNIIGCDIALGEVSGYISLGESVHSLDGEIVIGALINSGLHSRGDLISCSVGHTHVQYGSDQDVNI